MDNSIYEQALASREASRDRKARAKEGRSNTRFIVGIMLICALMSVGVTLYIHFVSSDVAYTETEEFCGDELPEAIATPELECASGARIVGVAPPGSTISLTVPLTAHQEEMRGVGEYTLTTTASVDGTFTLIAPYSTDGTITPSGMYTVTVAGVPHQVSVSVEDVLDENTITVG